MKRQINITKNITITVVTSGYSDRFLLHETTWAMTVYGRHGIDSTAQFSSEDQMHSMLRILGYSYNTIWKLDIKQKIHISGYVSPRHQQSRVISLDEYYSIKAYLLITRDADRYKPEHVQQQQQWLDEHPLHPDLKAIVDWQLTECDRKNKTFTTGAIPTGGKDNIP